MLAIFALAPAFATDPVYELAVWCRSGAPAEQLAKAAIWSFPEIAATPDQGAAILAGGCDLTTVLVATRGVQPTPPPPPKPPPPPNPPPPPQPPPKPDTLGGVTLGSQFNTTGWEYRPGSYQKGATIAGLDGLLYVEVCGSRVQAVTFQVHYLNHFTDGPHLHYSNDPAVDSQRNMATMYDALVASGWVDVGYAPPKDDRGSIHRFIKDGNDRYLSGTCDTLINGTYRCSATIQTASTTVCTQGL